MSGFLKPEALWLFSDFHLDEASSKRSRMKVRMLYFCFNLACGLGMPKLPNFAAHFAAAGWHVREEEYLSDRELVTRCYQRLEP